MFGPGDGAIFLGDATTHGGRVISGQPNYIVNGRQVAVVGDKVTCPKDGHGVCSIIEGHPTITVNGKPVAFHGCATSCGARLISSMNSVHAIGSPGQSALSEERRSSPSPTRFQQPQQRNSFVDTSEPTCEHPDQALDLAAYIANEIQKNALSEPAQKMRRWNSVSAADEEARWRDRLNDPSLSQRERESLSMARPNFRQAESVARNSALAEWTYMVRQGGDWDHKEYIQKNPDQFSSLGKSSYQWHHKYGEYEYYYDIWSNIHYGYLGVYCGFSADAMLDGAGLEQVGTDILNPEKVVTDRSVLNGPGLRRFDDSTDNLSIRIGFELFEEYPDSSQLTAEIVMQKVVAAPYPIGLYSKILHDCEIARARPEEGQ